MTRRLAGLLFLLFTFAFCLFTQTAFPQSIWIDRSVDRAVWLEIQKPDFTDEYFSSLGFSGAQPQTTLPTSNWYLSARWRVSGTLFLKAEIPFVNSGIKYTIGAGIEGGTRSTSENQFGNPSVGMEIHVPGSPVLTEIGLRLPIVDDAHLFSSAFGTFTDFDRFEAFLPDFLTVTTIINYQYHAPTGLLLRLLYGTAFFIPTESGPDPKLFYDYSAQVGYQLNRVSATVVLTGRALIPEIYLDFGEGTAHQLGFAANYSFDHFTPGLHFRLPLDDDLQRNLDFVFGLSVGYRLP